MASKNILARCVSVSPPPPSDAIPPLNSNWSCPCCCARLTAMVMRSAWSLSAICLWDVHRLESDRPPPSTTIPTNCRRSVPSAGGGWRVSSACSNVLGTATQPLSSSNHKDAQASRRPSSGRLVSAINPPSSSSRVQKSGSSASASNLEATNIAQYASALRRATGAARSR